MRKWLSVAALLAALTCAGPAAADTPAQVYSDFAEDGVLSCGHSRGALKGVLSDASLHQYGDPYTYLGLKLAVRKQLAGGCRRNDRTGTFFSTPVPNSSGQQPTGTAKSSGSTRRGGSRENESNSSTGPGNVS